jgi:hypothetical protein
MDNRLQTFTGYTLVDITATGVTRGIDELLRNQQRNWETVLQVIGLRSQPLEIKLPRLFEDIDVSHTEFGEFYEGTQHVWVWEFSVEHEDVFRRGDDPIAFLREAFDQVPIIVGLTETARFMLPIFYTSGAIKNIYFEIG